MVVEEESDVKEDINTKKDDEQEFTSFTDDEDDSSVEVSLEFYKIL